MTTSHVSISLRANWEYWTYWMSKYEEWHLSVCLFVCLSVSVCVCMCLSVCLSVCLYVCMYMYVYVCVSVSVVCVSVCLSVTVILYVQMPGRSDEMFIQKLYLRHLKKDKGRVDQTREGSHFSKPRLSSVYISILCPSLCVLGTVWRVWVCG